jgi:hypothetical protein
MSRARPDFATAHGPCLGQLSPANLHSRPSPPPPPPLPPSWKESSMIQYINLRNKISKGDYNPSFTPPWTQLLGHRRLVVATFFIVVVVRGCKPVDGRSPQSLLSTTKASNNLSKPADSQAAGRIQNRRKSRSGQECKASNDESLLNTGTWTTLAQPWGTPRLG